MRQFTSTEFQRLSNSAQKKHITQLLIDEVKASPVDGRPTAIVMAGIPGAGKTEYLDSLNEKFIEAGLTERFVRIDLDIIVTVLPEYTPKTDRKFRSKGSYILSGCIDKLMTNNYNLMIDGTFSGTTGASINNIDRLLSHGYDVILYWMWDSPESAWFYTQKREVETNRGIDREGFIESCANICNNLKTAMNNFKDNPSFSMVAIKQTELRSKQYVSLTNYKDIDNLIDQGYNITELRNSL